MKKNYTLVNLFVLILLLGLTLNASAQCPGVTAPVGVAPVEKACNSGVDMNNLVVQEYAVAHDGSDKFLFLVLAPVFSTEFPEEKVIIGVSQDGTFDFTMDSLGMAYGPGEYCYQGFAYKQEDLDRIVTTVNSFVCSLFPEIPTCADRPTNPFDVPANLADILGVVQAIAGDFSVSTVVNLITETLNQELCYDVAMETHCIQLVDATDEYCTSLSFEDTQYQGFSLLPNYPNPFDDITNINFMNDAASDVEFTVYDLTGRLVHQETVRATNGENNFTFNASDYSSGLYFYNLHNGVTMLTGKMNVK